MNRNKVEEKVKVKEFAKKIQPVYKLLNWTWWDSKKPPTVKAIEETLFRLLGELYSSPKSERISTGGLFAEREDGNVISFGFKMNEY